MSNGVKTSATPYFQETLPLVRAILVLPILDGLQFSHLGLSKNNVVEKEISSKQIETLYSCRHAKICL